MKSKDATSTNAVQPFASDVDYLYAEGEYLMARVARFELQRVMTESKDEGIGRSSARRRAAPATDGDRWAAATEAEQRARTDLDHRIAATTATGKVLGLDAVVATHGLNVVERTTLLITALQALDFRFEVLIGKISDCNYKCGPSPEVVWEFLELDPAARVASRVCYLLPRDNYTSHRATIRNPFLA